MLFSSHNKTHMLHHYVSNVLYYYHHRNITIKLVTYIVYTKTIHIVKPVLCDQPLNGTLQYGHIRQVVA